VIADSPQGLYCPAGAFHLDPLLPVERAVVTHAHGDHARAGSASYLCTPETGALLRRRLLGAPVETLRYGERRRIGDVTVSLHPAGHMLGSAQVRIEGPAGVWVVSGDYKREADPTCAPFEPLPCDVFVSEATYALPLFRWDDPAAVASEIVAWWQGNPGKTSVLFCYALGKAQRLLAEIGRITDRPVWVHGMIEPFAQVYRECGVRLAETRHVGDERGLAHARPPGQDEQLDRAGPHALRGAGSPPTRRGAEPRSSRSSRSPPAAPKTRHAMATQEASKPSPTSSARPTCR